MRPMSRKSRYRSSSAPSSRNAKTKAAGGWSSLDSTWNRPPSMGLDHRPRPTAPPRQFEVEAEVLAPPPGGGKAADRHLVLEGLHRVAQHEALLRIHPDGRHQPSLQARTETNPQRFQLGQLG